MIIAKTVQKGQHITLEDVVTTFQYSANLKMQFVKDERYKDYILTGWYRCFKDKEYLLNIDENGIFTLDKNVFKQRGTVYFSFSLNKADEIIHLGVVEYTVEEAFGNGDAILPEDQNTWIKVVSRVVKDQVSDIWDKDYKPQLDANLEQIEAKTDEINHAAEEVKQKALESSSNAKSALESANNALESANLAENAKEKALELATSAEQSKNEASVFADAANQAKNGALESARSASDSAMSALASSNTAKDHLDSVNNAVNNFNADYEQKVNEFNQDYTSKVDNFNTSVEDANNTLSVKIEKANTDLDKKIADANTNIDEKITTATEQANKAKMEADRAVSATDGKLDKNQGADNVGKSLIIDAEGNVICGDAGINADEVNSIIDTAIENKLYTQEEVDYLLRDKMDKPYVDITIDNDTTIDCTMDGNFKIGTIKGNTHQNVETDIVPTPSRPIPIVSKKTLANGEYVELRSLKETRNLFDLGVQNQVDLIPLTEAYRKIDIPIILKKNTTYTFKYDDFEIPAFLWIVLKIIDSEGNSYTSINQKNDSNEQIKINGKTNYFATKTDDKIFFSYYVSSLNETTGQWKQNIETFKTHWYTKIIKNIMITEGSTAPTSYIPPTVRDYKIVDHVNKKSWIERNVGVKELTSKNYKSLDGAYVVTNLIEQNTKLNVNLFLSNKSYYQTKQNISEMNLYIFSNSGANLVEILMDENHRTVETAKRWFDENKPIFQYQLETSAIEEIEYSESDTTEVGCSFQDTTSPSPTIPSEIISCTPRTNNLFDINFVEKWKNYTDGMSVENGVVRISNTDCYLNPRKTVAITIDKSATYCLRFDFNVIAGNATYGNIALINYANDNPTSFGNGSAKWLDAGKYYLLFYQGIKNTEENNIVEYSNIMLFENKKNLTEFEPHGKYKLNLKTCGKNLLNAGVASGYRKNCTVEVENGIITMTPLTADTDTYLNTLNVKGSPYDKNCGTLIDVSNVKKVTVTISNEIFNKNYAALYDENLTIIMLYSFIDQNIFTIDLSKYNNAKYMTVRIGNGAMPAGSHSTTVQIEAGDTATEYQPYQESAVKLFLDEPLLSSSDKLIRDTIDVTNKKLNKNLIYYKFTGEEIFRNDYVYQPGYYGRYFNVDTIYISPSTPIALNCNILPYANQSWAHERECFSQNANQVHLKFSNKRLGISDDTPIEQKRVAFDNYVKGLETPIIFTLILKEAEITPLEPELVEKLKTLKTFYPITHVFINNEIKATLDCKYPKDLILSQQKLEATVLTLQEEVVKNV